MTSKIDELSQSLDKINAGQNPHSADEECSDLLEVATLLHKCDIPVRPPEHILSATVQRAAEGLANRGRPRRYAWLYSGVIGAAAALLIFVGIHGFPSTQEMTTIVTPAPQGAPAASLKDAQPVDSSPAPVLPAKESKSLSSETSESKSEVPAPSSPSSIQYSSRPASPSVPAANQTPAGPPAARQAPEPVPFMKEALPPPSAAKSLLPAAIALRLPDRKPDSIVKDPVTGAIRQVFDTGTPRELIITQRPKPQTDNDTTINPKQYVLRETDKGASEASKSLNKVVVVIQGLEVTIEGRHTVQELTELARRLKPGNI